jgi:hypothetical protein
MRRLDWLRCFDFEDGSVHKVGHVGEAHILFQGDGGFIVAFEGDTADGVVEFATDGEEEFCVRLLGVDGDSMLALRAADADDDCAIHYEIRRWGGDFKEGYYYSLIRRGVIL